VTKSEGVGVVTDRQSDQERAAMTTRDAAQRIADVLNEVRAAGFTTTLVDWPESLSVCRADATFTTAEPLAIVERDDHWVVERQ
jgi:hypothetical protein